MKLLKVIDNTANFLKQVDQAIDKSLNQMAIDIDRLSKLQVPIKKGQLRASGHHAKVSDKHYQIWYNKVYARFQHEGGDGKRVVRNYSKAGTKAHFLTDPAAIITKDEAKYLKHFFDKIKLKT